MGKSYNIPEFLKYLNVKGSNRDDIQVVHYDEHHNIRLQSPVIELDFYLMAIKNNIDVDPPIEEMSNSFLFLDKPGNKMEWNLSKPFFGYAIFVNSKLLDRVASAYTFTGYNRHEALFLTDRESKILQDLFIKAYEEYQRDNFSVEVLVSYASLILSYTQTFYERQFDTQSKLYDKVVADFYRNIEHYFSDNKSTDKLPSVAFFADKAGLSVNYFGDVIKHFTGQSPIEHIHQYIIQLSKKYLRETKLSINEIAYSLGFEYPTYFTRFFRQKTGISPSKFRNK